MIVGLSIENGMIRHDILIVSKWKRRFDIRVYDLDVRFDMACCSWVVDLLGPNIPGSPFTSIIALLLSGVATLVLVPAKRVLPDLGSATLIGLIFNSIAYVFLIVYSRKRRHISHGA